MGLARRDGGIPQPRQTVSVVSDKVIMATRWSLVLRSNCLISEENDIRRAHLGDWDVYYINIWVWSRSSITSTFRRQMYHNPGDKHSK